MYYNVYVTIESPRLQLLLLRNIINNVSYIENIYS